MKKSYGFTLAEVLITLGIIGVVAAMTIPTLMNQTSGAEFKSGIKKMVSSLNQAVTMSVALDSMDFADMSSTDSTSTLSAAYLLGHKLNVINSALGTAPIGDLGGKFGGTNYTLLLNDGSVISYDRTATSCSGLNTFCRIIVDVNGTKKPNTLSTATNDASKAGLADQFVLDFYNQQVTPRNNAAKYALFN